MKKDLEIELEVEPENGLKRNLKTNSKKRVDKSLADVFKKQLDQDFE